MTYPDPLRRFLITLPAMIASMMVAVDITIANVALPHMQASVGASSDQIIWVLTSYLIAGAISTPLSGWLAERFGRKAVMVWSVAGFTIASALCGASNDIAMLVAARTLQGACGATLIPMSQALLLDINPPENYAKAMAIFSLGSMTGPIIGPSLGGWLTDSLSWRWVFFINVPFGIISFSLMLAYLTKTRNQTPPRFDMFGFITVSAALASFQLMIDRGEQLDWFDSAEIWLYAVILVVSVYLTVIHVFTARKTFIRPELFANRNFAIGCVFSLLLGVAIFAAVPMIVVMTQSLLGYSAFETGMTGLPRSFGTILMMLLASRISRYVDMRLAMAAGLVVSAFGLMVYSDVDLYTDERTLLIASFIQGAGAGLIFVPIQVVVFSTLPQGLRNEGAATYALIRNLGNAIGISLLQRELTHSSAASREHLAENVRPDNPAVQYTMPDFDFGAIESLARMKGEVVRQASMVANAELYQMLVLIPLAMVPLVFFLKSVSAPPEGKPLPIVE